MTDIVGLLLPFFGLIFLGYIAARVTRQSKEAMGWLSTFIVYLALPALFYQLLSQTPVEQLARWDFIMTNVAATFCIFALVFAIAVGLRRATVPESTIQSLAGAYGNIGYMGPGIAILTFGEAAAIPVALIFCFENMMHFILTPSLMALSGRQKRGLPRLVLGIVKSIVFHPFIIATALGVTAAAVDFNEPEPFERLIAYLAQAAAPSALFAMGVTLALNPLRRVPGELTFIVPIKLIVHPLIMYLFLVWAGPFPETWVFTAVLLAALPTATNVFVLAQQYGTWVERASASVLITTVFSVGSLSFLLYAITSGLLPPDPFAG